MVHQCKRCGSEWEHKYPLVRHLNRKNPCDPVLSDILFSDLLEEVSDKREKKYKCKHCLKLFTNKQSKYVHQRNCKRITEVLPVNDVQQLANTVVFLQAKVAELEAAQTKAMFPMVNKGTINNNTQNNFIQINVRDFARSEHRDYLDSQFLLECFKDMDMVKLMEEIHFNPEHPENHNVKVKNQNKNQMTYYDSGKWVVRKKDEVLREMALNGRRVLHSFGKEKKIGN
jgi:hypothetical protein